MHSSDIVVGVRRGLVWLCANLHAPPNAPLEVRWQPARMPAGDALGDSLRVGGVAVRDVPTTHATVSVGAPGSWGAQVGANDCGVAIGASPAAVSAALGSEGLGGSELVRLGLERGDSARAALDVIVELLERHGQRAERPGGGACSEGPAGGPSACRSCCLLVADAGEAYLLETAGRRWAVDRVTASRAVSGALSIPGFADRHGDWLRATRARASARARRACAGSATARRTSELFALLRDHGDAAPPPLLRWAGAAVRGRCHHAGARTPEQTAGSWVSELGPSVHHWTTGSSAPCIGLFKPVSPNEPLTLPTPTPGLADDDSLWWRHERVRRAVARNPPWLTPERLAERDATELRWVKERATSAEAFALGDALLRRWWAELETGRGQDCRPWSDRRYWRALDRSAGLTAS